MAEEIRTISDNTQIRIAPSDVYHRDRNKVEGSVTIHDREGLSYEARMATTLIERWGPVMAVPNGETSAGYPQSRPATPEEIVQKCCATAALAAEEIRKRGWTMQLPSLEEIDAVVNPVEAGESPS